MATSDSVVAGRKFSLVLVVLLSLCTSVQTEANFTVWTTRRITADIYKLNLLEAHSNCAVDPKGLTRTYLVSEKQCVSDEELLSRCHSTISPTECSAFLISIVKDLDSQYSTIVNINCFSKLIFVVSFGFNETNQPLNSSFCNISSLEVYRGREQAIEISHQGFYINDNGSIEIQRDQLVYEIEDYKGELYRMSLSCSGGGLPEGGCLFFKVMGRTYTTEYKFNDTVPGTFQHNNHIMVPNVSSDPTGESITTPTASVQSTTIIVSTTEISIFVADGTLFYTLIGVGGGIIVLIFSFIVVCVLICFSVQRKRKSHTFTTATTLPTHNGIQTQGFEHIGLPSNIANFKLDAPPLLGITSSEGVSEPDGPGVKSCFTRLSVSSTLTPVPTHLDATVQDSEEQLYACPIMSNVCEPGATSR